MELSKKKFLFISSANLSTNPRVLKEIRLALSNGAEVDFVGFRIGGWSDENDDKLRLALPFFNCTYLDATRGSFIIWFFDSVMERLARALWVLMPGNPFIGALAHSKRTLRLLSFVKKSPPGRYDLIVGHTLAAFYPSYVASRRMKARLGLDVEDYHPGERIEPPVKGEKKRREILLEKLLPRADYISSAAPLIADEVNRLVPGAREKNKVILNYFSNTEFEFPVPGSGDKLALVWFSQNISRGRGLEILLSVWDKLQNMFSLTLIGKLDDNFYHQYLLQHTGITVLPAMNQADLHKELKKYDIGLALEDANADYNRNICLTNKILAYYQAGLYVLATDTAAQVGFISGNPLHGATTSGNPAEMYRALSGLFEVKTTIRERTAERFKSAQLFSWEHEGQRLLHIWHGVLT